MLKTYLYLPEELNSQIILLASTHQKSKAEMIRRALEIGVTAVARQKHSSANAMLKIAEIGKGYKFDGPKDGSERIDELLWGKDWSKDA